eukprot:TRINITY_DN2759_c1_g2_i1.p2 TRINITY_DN2759_c1_g2~~TRINITY_DN2759_c1_g2_i1.p2  ORF type:complete len:433 (+),score=151.80 TRINITY_DN2759_c1_g2_i1:42-1301(+)
MADPTTELGPSAAAELYRDDGDDGSDTAPASVSRSPLEPPPPPAQPPPALAAAQPPPALAAAQPPSPSKPPTAALQGTWQTSRGLRVLVDGLTVSWVTPDGQSREVGLDADDGELYFVGNRLLTDCGARPKLLRWEDGAEWKRCATPPPVPDRRPPQPPASALSPPRGPPAASFSTDAAPIAAAPAAAAPAAAAPAADPPAAAPASPAAGSPAGSPAGPAAAPALAARDDVSPPRRDSRPADSDTPPRPPAPKLRPGDTVRVTDDVPAARLACATRSTIQRWRSRREAMCGREGVVERVDALDDTVQIRFSPSLAYWWPVETVCHVESAKASSRLTQWLRRGRQQQPQRLPEADDDAAGETAKQCRCSVCGALRGALRCCGSARRAAMSERAGWIVACIVLIAVLGGIFGNFAKEQGWF